MSTTSFVIEEFEFHDQLITVELEVDYDVSAYVPARFYLANGDPGYPAEGGEVDFSATVVEAFHEFGAAATPLELLELQAAIDDRLDKSHTLRQEIEEHCRQEATNRAQDRYLDRD
jgi:hypothetical protein